MLFLDEAAVKIHKQECQGGGLDQRQEDEVSVALSPLCFDSFVDITLRCISLWRSKLYDVD